MDSIFKNIGILKFEGVFSSEDKCLEYLSETKWKNGFVCRHCHNTNYCKGKKPFSRRCTRCKHEESPTAHTIYHKCKIPLVDAFKITYYVCHRPDLSTHELSVNINLRQMTCWKFKKKILECIDSRGDLNLLEKETIKKNLTA
jgi:hypothetical protein